MSYPFFLGYGRDEAFPQDTDLSPVPYPNRLTDIALLIRKYVGEGHPTIGCFSRITDVRNKTVEELQQLHHLGFDYLTIGVESGDSETLTRV